jgi:hypothetical protein
MKKLYAILFITGISLAASAQLVYKDVAGIFYNRCTACHHTNGGAPFSMMSYSETAPWAATIQTDLNSGKMPPWPPDTTYSRLLHERIITTSEKAAILSWISTGSQAGDTSIANGCPAPPVYTKYHLVGTPDLVLKVPAFASNASGSDAYNCFALPTGLSQDRILRAFEIVPNNPGIVHHVVVSVDTTGTVNSDVSGGCFNQPGDFGVGGYAPGSPPSVYPSSPQLKLGMKIKSGSKFILQMHYPAGSAGQVDSTEIRLYFYPAGTPGIRPVYSNTFLQNWSMAIMPNTTATYTAKYPSGSGTLPSSISIFATSPHAHHLNRTMTVYAYKASPIDTIKLIRIPVWDFNWQGLYVHPNMVKVPAGYKLGSKHFYDNTTNNPDNPNNPPQFVQSGTSTTDEMLFDSFEWTPYQAGDELIDIGSILASDSLLTTAVNEVSVSDISSAAFPNPFGDYITIGYELTKPAKTEVSVYNMFGEEVKTLSSQFNSAGTYSVLWDGKNSSGTKVPAGVYLYTIHAGKTAVSGKIMLMPK